MNMIINCKICLNLVDEYLGKRLDADSRQVIENHLEHCASCQARYAQERDFRQRLQTQLIARPRAGFADHVLARTVEHHRNKASRNWSFFGGAIAASFIIAVTSFVLRIAPQSDADLVRQTLALNQVQNISLALDSREELKGARIILQLPDNVELRGFPGQRMISWNTDIDRGVNLLSLPVLGIAEKNGLLVARLEHGNKSKEYTVELRVRAPGVSGGLKREEAVVISRTDSRYTGYVRLAGNVEGNA